MKQNISVSTKPLDDIIAISDNTSDKDKKVPILYSDVEKLKKVFKSSNKNLWNYLQKSANKKQ